MRRNLLLLPAACCLLLLLLPLLLLPLILLLLLLLFVMCLSRMLQTLHPGPALSAPMARSLWPAPLAPPSAPSAPQVSAQLCLSHLLPAYVFMFIGCLHACTVRAATGD